MEVLCTEGMGGGYEAGIRGVGVHVCGNDDVWWQRVLAYLPDDAPE